VSGLWLTSYIVLWVLLLAMAVVLVSTLRNLGVVYSLVSSGAAFTSPGRKPSTLKQGEVVPDATWFTASGEPTPVSTYRGSKMAFAVVSPSCASCGGFLEMAVEDGPDPLDDYLRDFTVISLGSVIQTSQFLDDLRAKGMSTAKLSVLYDDHGEVLRRWGFTTTPAMVVIDEEMRMVRQVFGGRQRPSPTENIRSQAILVPVSPASDPDETGV
jgi:hypothetical protein